MVPTPVHFSSTALPRLLLTLASVASQYVPNLPNFGFSFASLGFGNSNATWTAEPSLHSFAKRDGDHPHDVKFIVFACLIPILVLSSGVFAGLTLGYMSLDETQLNVLSISGTPEQKKYANKIKPIRKDGHLLLVTLLLANMIVNETLPVISDPVLGGGVPSVVVSTVLIVIFAEIIPQSLCTRYGLYFGAKMVGLVRILIWTLGIVAWPVARLLEFALGPHHGIIYRRAELKELIAMHSSVGEYGGDLKTDTVTIIGGALDLQEKVVKQAMTPIEDVFMLSINAKLDYETLRQICLTGHSRIPVYEEIEVPIQTLSAVGAVESKECLGNAVSETSVNGLMSVKRTNPKTHKVKKIIGILLVKQCVLLDPKDATPIRKIPLNKVPFVPNNEPLLGILDKFQEGRSHMAIVSRFSVARAVSVKKAVKRGLTQRLRDRVGMGDNDSSSGSDSEDEGYHEQRRRRGCKKKNRRSEDNESDNEATLKEVSEKEDEVQSESGKERRPRFGRRGGSNKKPSDIEMGVVDDGNDQEAATKGLKGSLTLPKASFGRFEQSMPADAVLTKEGADEFLQGIDPAMMPLGIITLEDVLEELIGEEIYDEFDPQGHPDLKSYGQNDAKSAQSIKCKNSVPQLIAGSSTYTDSTVGVASNDGSKSLSLTPIIRPTALPALRGINFKNFPFTRSRSAPPTPRDLITNKPGVDTAPATVPEGVVAPDDLANAVIPPIDRDMDGETTLSDRSHYHPETSYNMLHTPSVDVPSMQTKSSGGSNQAMFQIRAPIPVSVAPVYVPALTLPVMHPPLSRSSSPAPSLEHVILVERKRRATSGATTMPVPKGGRFKSSPLTGDRSAVVVAERVKRTMGLDIDDD